MDLDSKGSCSRDTWSQPPGIPPGLAPGLDAGPPAFRQDLPSLWARPTANNVFFRGPAAARPTEKASRAGKVLKVEPVEFQACRPGGGGNRCGVWRQRPRVRTGGGFRSWSEAGHTGIAFSSPVRRAWLLWRTKNRGERGDKVCHRAVRSSRSGDEGLLAPEPCTAFL